MLKINRLRIEIETDNGLYGIDEVFDSGLNFLASEDNTCGKSSIIEAFYYGLGFEEIIGGRGEKVLTSAYKTFIEDGENKLSVLEAKIYLEISNGQEEVTLYRTAKMANRDSRLITVYYSSLDEITKKETLVEDMYVHMPNSATNAKGFHSFLEKFLHLQLPMVPSADGNQRKLYLQLIFSCMFIEQKHGWGDIFSGIPVLGVKDSKKRVLEFVLNLDTLSNEKKKENLKYEEAQIKNDWALEFRELQNAVNRETCTIIGLPVSPCILSQIDISGIHILKNKQELENDIAGLKEEYESLEAIKPKVIDNFDDLQEELEKTEEDIEKFENKMRWLREKIVNENSCIRVLNDNIEILENDLRNNKDAARLRELGSSLECMTSENICPICQQSIDDTLLPVIEGMEIMSIDQNIRHLEAQKIMLFYAKESHRNNKAEMDAELQQLQGRVFSLRRLAMALRNDLYTVEEDVSEAIVYKKIDLLTRIEKLEDLQVLAQEKKQRLLQLSEKWKQYLEEKRNVPSKKFSNDDLEKLYQLREKFVVNLKKYGYKSVIDMQEIKISEESYLPVIEEFDMKFDSSASDNIRAIWAYTVALMQVSMGKSGNHPNVLIFDEPNQHSIIPNDMEKFFDSIIKLENKCQIIVGITIKDSDTKSILGNLPKGMYKLITVKNKAFGKME
ncbi:MAG: hypothetical protein K0R50_1598 [Eubacterium sp.]|jgi:hypothetical protein|nr:hypothetical protein [Eubacterium sp.]